MSVLYKIASRRTATTPPRHASSAPPNPWKTRTWLDSEMPPGDTRFNINGGREDGGGAVAQEFEVYWAYGVNNA